MKRIIFMGIVLSLSNAVMAQSFVDNALLFSRTRAGGSARVQALGGAQIALGGDFSSAFSNPGGLGMFNRSEFTFSPALNFLNSDAAYLNEATDDSKTGLSVPSLGLVFHHDSERESGFLGGSFAITITRTNDLNSIFRYEGTNSNSSIIDYFKDDAYYYNPQDMLSGGDDFYNITALAYNNYLLEDIYDNNGNVNYVSALDPLDADPVNGFPAEIRTVRQEEIVKRSGNQNQWSFSYGANFSDKFFFGGGLGITSIKYKFTQIFNESNFTFDQSPNYNPLNNFSVEENIDIRGTGLNLTLGLIARPVNFLQIGASIITPSIYSITDNYNASVTSQWNNFNYIDGAGNSIRLNKVTEEFDTPLISKYFLNTPLRFNTGVALISKFGFITGDVEMINYSKAYYESGELNDDFDADNDDIQADYASVVNYRLGAEFRYDIYRVRGGYNFMADPYVSTRGLDRSTTTISGGVGVRTKEFFIDLAVLNSTTQASRTPYTAPGKETNTAILDLKSTLALITVGFTF